MSQKNKDKTRVKKKGGKQRVIKNQIEKEKNNKTLSKKREKGREKT
jgi:hypothetical protein